MPLVTRQGHHLLNIHAGRCEHSLERATERVKVCAASAWYRSMASSGGAVGIASRTACRAAQVVPFARASIAPPFRRFQFTGTQYVEIRLLSAAQS